MNALLALAILAAATGAYYGNRTALALIASTIFSTLLCEAGVGFEPALWIAIDMMVVAWVVINCVERLFQGEHCRRRDMLVLALFLAIWPLYFIPWEHRSPAIDFIIVIQLIATFPYRRLGRRLRRQKAKPKNDNIMRMAYGR